MRADLRIKKHRPTITVISWPPPGLHNFFTLAILCRAARLGCTLFYSLNGCFWVDICNTISIIKNKYRKSKQQNNKELYRLRSCSPFCIRLCFLTNSYFFNIWLSFFIMDTVIILAWANVYSCASATLCLSGTVVNTSWQRIFALYYMFKLKSLQ